MNSVKSLDTVQVLRAVAAIGVVFFHAGNPGWVTRILDSGVDLFFVISGFIMMYVHYDDINIPKKVAGFIRKRVVRILPLYWVVLILMVVYEHPPLREIISAIILLPVPDPVVAVSWTLSHEFLFYAIFVTLIANKVAGTLVLSVWGAMILCAALFAPQNALGLIGEFVFSHYNGLFFLGMLTALMYRNVPSIGGYRATSMLALGVILIIGVGVVNIFVTPIEIALRTLLNGVSATLVLLGALYIDPKVTVPRVLVFLGNASYAIYITHLLSFLVVYKVLHETFGQKNVGLVFASLVIAGIIGGCIVHWYVERPLALFMRSPTLVIMKKKLS